MDKIPAWCKVEHENHRVEVSQEGVSINPKFRQKDLDTLADDLNELFEGHKDWDRTRAEVNYDEMVRCQFCDEVYVPFYDDKRNEDVCYHCNKGKLEWAIKIMADSEKKGDLK